MGVVQVGAARHSDLVRVLRGDVEVELVVVRQEVVRQPDARAEAIAHETKRARPALGELRAPPRLAALAARVQVVEPLVPVVLLLLLCPPRRRPAQGTARRLRLSLTDGHAL